MELAKITKEEFRTRREKLCSKLEENSFVLLAGAVGPKGEETFQQSKDFHYHCDIDISGAYLLINSANQHSTLFLPHKNQVDKRSDDPVVSFENAELAIEQSGVDAVKPIEDLSKSLSGAHNLYVLFEDDTVRGENRYHGMNWAVTLASDPWDGRLTRATQLIKNLRQRFPHINLLNLSPLMDEMRLIKSESEIARMRVAGKLTAAGVCDAMRATRDGVMEYQLDAVMRYHFLAGGGSDRAYNSIIACGSNILYPHYNANNKVLRDGDWLLCDSAADYKHYTSDIGRMWPVNGKYSEEQRSLYGYVIEYHKVVLDCIKPGKMVQEIHGEAAEKMRPVYDQWNFYSEEHKDIADFMFGFRGHISHGVGLNVHDGISVFGRGLHYHRPLEAGMVFSVDPSIIAMERNTYVRVEDTVVVTEDGIENLTADAPLELVDMEAMMREDGMLQAFPAINL